MAVGGYVFALTSLNWQTVPILGTPWNAVWSMIFAGIGGVVFGLVIGGIAARLRGPYLAGLTLGVAVGVPAIANRFPGLLGGENGLMLQVPYPAGGYQSVSEVPSDDFSEEGSGEDFGGDEPLYEEIPDDLFDEAPVDDGFAEEDMLTDDDMLTEDDFLSEDDFATDEGFEADLDSELDEGAADELVDTPGIGDSDVGGDLDVAGVDSGFVIEQWQASVAIAAACIVGFIALNLVRGRQGRVWQAVRDDPIAAAVSGISPSGSKVSAFVVSSLFAALAGAVFAQILSYVGPGAFTLGLSLSLLVGIVLGGRNSFIGAIIGAVILVWLPEFVLGLSADRGWEDQITNNAPNFIYGLLVVIVVLVAPGGLVGGVQGLLRRGKAGSRSG
jgi:ABC-type branched-subunit amino acid transport system permease subunit